MTTETETDTGATETTEAAAAAVTETTGQTETGEVAAAGGDASHSAADAVSEHAVGMPQLDFSTFPNQIFWLIVTLVVVYLILTKVAMPRISKVLSERHNAIANDLASAEDFKQKAVEAEEAYNAALVEARAEAQRIVGEAKADIQKDLDVAIEKADAQIAAKSAESAVAIGEIQKNAVKSIQEVADDTAAEVVAKLMPGSGDAKTIKAAVAARMKG